MADAQGGGSPRRRRAAGLSPSPSPSPCPSSAPRLPRDARFVSDALKIHFPNGGFESVDCGDAPDAKGLVALVLSRLSQGPRLYSKCYAVRGRRQSGETRWIHRDATAAELRDARSPDCRFELRVRYAPSDLRDLHREDRATFNFYYDQVLLVLHFLYYFQFYSKIIYLLTFSPN